MEELEKILEKAFPKYSSEYEELAQRNTDERLKCYNAIKEAYNLALDRAAEKATTTNNSPPEGTHSDILNITNFYSVDKNSILNLKITWKS